MPKVSWSRFMFLTLLIFVLGLAACDNSGSSDEASTDDSEMATEESETATEESTEDSETATEESAESEPKVTEFEPAFPEQTRAPAVETEAELNVEVVAEGLGVSWGMEEFDNNRLLVTQRDEGELLILNLEDGSVSDPIEGVPEVNNEDQGGLLDVTVAPDFDESRLVFMTFAQDMEDGTVTAVGKGVLSEDETSLED
ncbi:MAG: PQQ-dependent sugar dehydrogenase, partial [Jeotgalicoccus sp.]|nr:PQQ-dependent sugar dehydrogenase [Jeotgalicoccus sp.]